MTTLDRHQEEIRRNLDAWRRKPLLRSIYTSFYRRILEFVDVSRPGIVVELGSGIGNLKAHVSSALATDLFPNPWLDLACDAYELPLAAGSVSHLVLFDVFHHLEAPFAFLKEARRVLGPGGRVILFEPCISLTSYPVYGLLHPEPVVWRRPISLEEELPRPRAYYAAQGNATRLFFGAVEEGGIAGWKIEHREAFSCFSYLLSGGYSRPAFYPARWLSGFQKCDRFLSRWPRLFACRCLVVLSRI